MARPEQSLRPEILFDHPEDSPNQEGLRRAADLLAKILDTAIKIPGTNIRIGLDPLMGLIPGIGDALSSLIGSWMLVIASQLHVPKIVMTRMDCSRLDVTLQFPQTCKQHRPAGRTQGTPCTMVRKEMIMK